MHKNRVNNDDFTIKDRIAFIIGFYAIIFPIIFAFGGLAVIVCLLFIK